MACSFRGPNSRILWQRWLYTCCIRPSLPYSTAASWLIVALFPGLISKYRSKITKQLRKVNNPPEPRLSFLPRSFSVLYCKRVSAPRSRSIDRVYRANFFRKSRGFSSTNDTLRYIIQYTVNRPATRSHKNADFIFFNLLTRNFHASSQIS